MRKDFSERNTGQVAILALFNLLDAVFTYVWVTMGYAIEANPILEPLITTSPTGFMVYKLLLVNFLILVLWELSSHPLCRKLTLLTNLIYGWVTCVHAHFLLNQVFRP